MSRVVHPGSGSWFFTHPGVKKSPDFGSATREDLLFTSRKWTAIGCRREGESSRSKDPKAKLAGVIERLAFQTGDSVGIEIRHQNRITVHPFSWRKNSVPAQFGTGWVMSAGTTSLLQVRSSLYRKTNYYRNMLTISYSVLLFFFLTERKYDNRGGFTFLIGTVDPSP